MTTDESDEFRGKRGLLISTAHSGFPQKPSLTSVSFFNDEGVPVPVIWDDGPCFCAYCPNRHKSRSFQALYKHMRAKHADCVTKFREERIYVCARSDLVLDCSNAATRHMLFDESKLPFKGNPIQEWDERRDEKIRLEKNVDQGLGKGGNEDKENLDLVGPSACKEVDGGAAVKAGDKRGNEGAAGPSPKRRHISPTLAKTKGKEPEVSDMLLL